MGVSTPKFANGRMIGHECAFGHLHGNESDAINCDSDKYAKKNREKLNEQEKHRVRMIMESPNFAKALADAKALGAADADTAEECVLRNGLDAVTKARQAVQQLGIKKPEVLADEKKKKAAAEAEAKAAADKASGKPEDPPKP